MNNNLTPPTLLDGYKVDHRRQYPPNSRMVFSNMTARGSRVDGVEHVVLFGLQYFVQRFLIDDWNEKFFRQPKENVLEKFTRRINNYLGPNEVGTDHIEALHDLGYLPLKIMALPEGTHVPMRVPMLVMWNTEPEFFWLTNAIETILSTTLWLPCTSATTAFQYRKLLDEWCNKTAPEAIDFVPWQGHDFSFRGHTCLEAAQASGAAHLLSFTGTDTIPAIDFLEEYYDADSDTEIVGGSVSATEHSVMCMGGMEDEVETFRRLIEDVYPNGVVSIVSDTWDFWEVIDPDNGILDFLKAKIMARDGKVVVRPDSGDPVKIVAGWKTLTASSGTGESGEVLIPWSELDSQSDQYTRDFDAIYFAETGVFREITKDARIEGTDALFKVGREIKEVEIKGMIQCLWEIFGGTESSTGYQILDSHIGGIYGDSITLARAQAICERLEAKGFASTNLVYGIGSFTYQGAITPTAIVTRDTFGFAVKSTYGELLSTNHNALQQELVVSVEIFKDPVTDDGLKKSAKGLTAVVYDEVDPDAPLKLKDQATWDDVLNCAFQTVFEDGQLVRHQKLSEIRGVIKATAP